MTQYKIIIHCDQFNAVLVEEHESRDAALDQYARIFKKGGFLRFGEVLVNSDNVTFIQAQDIKEEPAVESEMVEVLNG
jgi:hypothetical protein